MSIYGENLSMPEKLTTDPISFYGISKLAGEKFYLS